jgi:hypothetical protein
MISESGLERAESALALAAARLVAAQLDAVLRGRYDDEAYDRLVLDYRRARMVADRYVGSSVTPVVRPVAA